MLLDIVEMAIGPCSDGLRSAVSRQPIQSRPRHVVSQRGRAGCGPVPFCHSFSSPTWPAAIGPNLGASLVGQWLQWRLPVLRCTRRLGGRWTTDGLRAFVAPRVAPGTACNPPPSIGEQWTLVRTWSHSSKYFTRRTQIAAETGRRPLRRCSPTAAGCAQASVKCTLVTSLCLKRRAATSMPKRRCCQPKAELVVRVMASANRTRVRISRPLKLPVPPATGSVPRLSCGAS